VSGIRGNEFPWAGRSVDKYSPPRATARTAAYPLVASSWAYYIFAAVGDVPSRDRKATTVRMADEKEKTGVSTVNAAVDGGLFQTSSTGKGEFVGLP
jgi:hypothetical protein